MALYRFIKSAPKKARRTSLFLSFLLMGIGMVLIVWTVWPILSFILIDQSILVKTVSPLADAMGGSKPLNPVAYAAGSSDFTNANVWFPTKPQKKIVAPVNSYTISIPSLGLLDATVIIAGDDLAKSLVHYGGTSLPGEYGNAVIFGHSTLPQFFKGTKEYKSIFATLPTIKIGDDIIITYDGVAYTYRVFDKVVVDPNDLSPLEQHFDDSYITVVTCVPPGTYLYRLNVKARLLRI